MGVRFPFLKCYKAREERYLLFMMSDAEQRALARDVSKLVRMQKNEAKIWLFIILGVLGLVCLPVAFAVIAGVLRFIFKLVFAS